MKEITITVSGPAGAGKTQLIELIKPLLVGNNYAIKHGKHSEFFGSSCKAQLLIIEKQTPSAGLGLCPPGWNARTRATNLLGAAAEQAAGLGKSLAEVQKVLQGLPLEFWSAGGDSDPR